MTDIFISYASGDRERLRPLRESLETSGWSVFWDEETPVGKNWRRNIFENLRAARCVIVAWSSASVESDWVSEEAGDALKRDVLLPVFIDPVEPPFGFADVQAMNLVDWSGEKEAEPFRRLANEVARILGTGPAIRSEPQAEIRSVGGVESHGRRRIMMGIGAMLIVAAGAALWLYIDEPKPLPPADEVTAPEPPNVSVGGDGIAVGRDLNHTGVIKFGD